MYKVIGYFKNGGQNYKPGDTASLDEATAKYLLELGGHIEPVEQATAAPAAPAEPETPPADPAPTVALQAEPQLPPAQPEAPADPAPQQPVGQPSAEQIANDPQLQ